MDEFWPRFGLCSMSSGRTRDLHGGADNGMLMVTASGTAVQIARTA